MIIETKRLYLRQLNKNDFNSIMEILGDGKTMYAYEHAFSKEEGMSWLNNQFIRYEKYGFGLWAVILKGTDKLIGQCGITMQNTGDREVHEVGYLFNRSYWHKGYATEAASACRNYAFDVLSVNEVCTIIRTNNLASINTAIRSGMLARGQIVKHYYGMDMPHIIFSINRKEYNKLTHKGRCIINGN